MVSQKHDHVIEMRVKMAEQLRTPEVANVPLDGKGHVVNMVCDVI